MPHWYQFFEKHSNDPCLGNSDRDQDGFLVFLSSGIGIIDSRDGAWRRSLRLFRFFTIDAVHKNGYHYTPSCDMLHKLIWSSRVFLSSEVYYKHVGLLQFCSILDYYKSLDAELL